jgi:RNA polymerase sigma factor (sigma-70 family)
MVAPALALESDQLDGAADPVSRVLALALDWSDAGRLDEAAFSQIVEEAELPARYYRDLLVALESAGIRLVEAEPPADPVDADSDSGWDGSGFREFLKRSSHRVLTAEEEIVLASRIDKGRLAQTALNQWPDMPVEDRRALERRVRDGRNATDDFVLHNVRLVIYNAKRFARNLSGGLSLEDLIQEGYFGLSRAIEKFDPSKGFKFSTYATWWIRQSIQRAIADKGRTIRVPVHYQQQFSDLRRAEQQLLADGVIPTAEAIASVMGIEVRHLAEIRRVALQPSSLDRRLGDDGGSLLDLLSDPTCSPVEQYVESVAISEAISQLLINVLTDRERVILSRRFGLGGRAPETLEAIADDFGLTRERIRQIQKSAIAKLGRPTQLAQLHSLLEGH